MGLQEKRKIAVPEIRLQEGQVRYRQRQRAGVLRQGVWETAETMNLSAKKLPGSMCSCHAGRTGPRHWII